MINESLKAVRLAANSRAPLRRGLIKIIAYPVFITEFFVVERFTVNSASMGTCINIIVIQIRTGSITRCSKKDASQGVCARGIYQPTLKPKC